MTGHPRGRRTVAAVALALSVLTGCGGDVALPRKTVLAHMPASFVESSFAVSGDLAHVAYQVKDGRRVRMVRDGVPGPPYVFLSTRSFAPETDVLFYWARAERNETFLVVGDTPYPIGFSRHEYLTFTPDGRRWAVVAAVPRDTAPPPEAARVLVLADGVERGRHHDASVPALSPDGQHLAYVVADPRDDGTTYRRLLVDGVERQTFTGTASRCIPPIDTAVEAPALPRYERSLYLADGTLVVLVREAEGWALYRGATRAAAYSVNVAPATDTPAFEVADEVCRNAPAIASGSLATATKVPVLAWWERAGGGTGERWRLVRDGLPVDDLVCVRPWDQPPVLSADGRAWAYACVTRGPETGQEILVVTPHARHGPYREVWSPALSEDGRRVAYGASVTGDAGSSWQVFADGTPYSPRYYATWRPRFDPGGAHLGWEAIPEQGARPLLALDGRDLVHFDELLNGPIYLEAGWVSWAVRRGRHLTRINLPLRGDGQQPD